MARFNAETAEQYGGTGGHGFFSLQNDKDTARVRFMYSNLDELSGYAVHKVTVDGRDRYVNCLREYNQPIADCPFCEAHMPQFAKIYVPLYVMDDNGGGEIKIWERGKKFIAKMVSLFSRYPNICGTVFEIERNGKKGDTATTYEIYPIETDNVKLTDLPEVPEILGGVVLDKTYDDMLEYLQRGKFGNAQQENVQQRRTPNEYGRRVDANNSRSRF